MNQCENCTKNSNCQFKGLADDCVKYTPAPRESKDSMRNNCSEKRYCMLMTIGGGAPKICYNYKPIIKGSFLYLQGGSNRND